MDSEDDLTPITLTDAQRDTLADILAQTYLEWKQKQDTPESDEQG